MQTVKFSPNPASSATVVGYLHEDNPNMPQRKLRPCVLICPGGGYDHISVRESDPPAFAFFARGYQVFILSYSLCEQAQNMRPLVEASCAMMQIREHCAKWNIISDKIAVCGFSAGAHLAACLGTLWNHPLLVQSTDVKSGLNKPNAMILGYPVISAGKFAHKSSISWLVGGDSGDNQGKKNIFSLENQVTSATPPAFLWHTVEDESVPVENTLLFVSALQKNHIPFECHIYPHGGHGQSMCNAEVGMPNAHCATWFPLCADWLDDLFEFQY